MAKYDFQYGGCNSYTHGTIMTLISPGDCTLLVACGCGIITMNSLSGSTLQCDTWLWDVMTLSSPGGSTLQCSRWLWEDMPLNSPRRPPYWNSTSGFDFDHITAVDMPFCISLRNFIQIGPPSAEKNDVMSIVKMADLSRRGF